MDTWLKWLIGIAIILVGLGYLILGSGNKCTSTGGTLSSGGIFITGGGCTCPSGYSYTVSKGCLTNAQAGCTVDSQGNKMCQLK